MNRIPPASVPPGATNTDRSVTVDGSDHSSPHRATQGEKTEHEFTPEQIVQGIDSALAEGAVTVIPSLIKLLAAQDPRRAQQVLNTIETGLAIATEAHPSIQETSP